MQVSINPSQLVDYKRKSSYPKDKNVKRKELYSNVVLLLEDKEIELKKADCDIFLKDAIKLVKNIELNKDKKDN